MLSLLPRAAASVASLLEHIPGSFTVSLMMDRTSSLLTTSQSPSLAITYSRSNQLLSASSKCICWNFSQAATRDTSIKVREYIRQCQNFVIIAPYSPKDTITIAITCNIFLTSKHNIFHIRITISMILKELLQKLSIRNWSFCPWYMMLKGKVNQTWSQMVIKESIKKGKQIVTSIFIKP